MSKLLKVAIAALMIIGITGCVSTSDIQVEKAQSEKVNLDGYKTYQFIEDSGIIENETTKKDLQKINITEEIEEMINSELAKKGKVPVSKDPDFFVAYLGGADMDAVKSKLDKNGKEVIEKSPEAALVLMLVDADSGSIIWMSTAEGEVKGGDADSIKKRLKYTVKKMLDGV
jgi:PBP1b-binding outer membrane lipoprotein LpoB